LTATNQPDRSPAPGIIPDPVHVHDDAAPPAATEQQHEPTVKRPNPVRLVAVKVMTALRGDKPMDNASPAVERDDAAPPDDEGTNADDR
jgi:hypothetical protein